MAQFFEGGANEFAGVIYGGYHQGTVDFLRNAPKLQSDVLGAAGKKFLELSNQVMGHFDIDDAMRKMRAAGRQVASVFQSNVIRELSTIGELQNPPSCMRHLMMACPEVRTAYLNQTIDGYSGQYVNAHGNAVGEEHYDYRRVMDGIVTETKDGFKASLYLEEVHEGDELYFDQQVEVLQTWAQLRIKLQEGRDDPTSRWNAAL